MGILLFLLLKSKVRILHANAGKMNEDSIIKIRFCQLLLTKPDFYDIFTYPKLLGIGLFPPKWERSFTIGETEMDKTQRDALTRKPIEQILTLKEAREVEAALNDAMQDVVQQLGDATRKERFQREKKMDAYATWAQQAELARRTLDSRIQRLRFHIKKTWTGFSDYGAADLPQQIITAIRNALSRETITEEKLFLFLANPHLLQPASCYEQARACLLTASVPARARGLYEIITITKNRADLEQLETIWKEGTKNPTTRSDAGRWLVSAYLVFGQFDDAERVAKNIPEADVAALVWCQLYSARSEKWYLSLARKRIGTIEEHQRFRLIGILLEKSGSPDDLAWLHELFRKLMPRCEQEKHRRHVIMTYVTALLSGGEVDEARDVVRAFAPKDASLLFQIAHASHKRSDLENALRAEMPESRALVIYGKAVESCLACDAPEAAYAMITACPDLHAKTTLWLQLGLETDSADALAKGLQGLTELPLSAADRPRTIYMKALIKKGQIEEARKQVVLFNQDEYLCSAYLRIHCAENGIPFPLD